MVYLKKVTTESEELDSVRKLYRKSFPLNERHLFRTIMGAHGRPFELYSIMDDQVFCGFISLLTSHDVSHIMFFAVCEHLRGKGYGSRTLELLKEMKCDKTIILDIEAEKPGAQNNEQRRSRKQFYQRNGFLETEVKYPWRGDNYEVLATRSDYTDSEFNQFWDETFPSFWKRVPR